jgi:hypothetical protein
MEFMLGFQDVFVSFGDTTLTIENIDKDANPQRANGNKIKLLSVFAFAV